MSEARALARVDTGVPGLDAILSGGLFKGGVYIIEGNPGAGKTTLGNQICFHRAGRGDSTIYVTLLAEAHTRMIGHLRGMSFFRPELIPSSIYYISAFKVLEQTKLEGLLKTLRDAIMQRKAEFLVIDGLISVEEYSPSSGDFKKFIHELQTISGMLGVTVLLLSSSERPTAFRPEHTMVDGLIELSENIVGMRSVRSLVVRKMRGAQQILGRHAFEITNAGLRIWPRIEALSHVAEHPEGQGGSVPLDIEGLDAMLGGGLPSATNTIVLGPSGSGKTMFGLQFLAAGIKRGENCLYVGFYERPTSVYAKSDHLRLGLRAAAEAKQLHLLWEGSVEHVIDGVLDRIFSTVAQHSIRRLCFDGLHGIRQLADPPERVRTIFAALGDELTRRGVTSVHTFEYGDVVGQHVPLPIDSMSALAENIVLMRQVEVKSELHRIISIVKMRDRAYDPSIRKLEISEGGFVVRDRFDDADRLLTGSAHTIK